MPHRDALFLLRLGGEIGTKARGTRLQFSRRLAHNIRDAVKSAGAAGEVDRQWSRMYLQAPRELALGVLPRVFGLQSFSVVERRSWSGLDDLVRQGVELFGAAVAGKRFAVRARRCGDRQRIPVRSGDVERSLGQQLLPAAAGVDLDHPEVTVCLEIQQDAVYYFAEQVQCPGGLPVGTGGRALALLSGGFDSAVAAWLLLKRGVQLDYLFLNLGGSAHEEGALRVAKVLADHWSYGSRPRFQAVDLRPFVEQMKERTDDRYWQILLKKMMLSAASQVADQLHVEALVTGEAVGQVSSQTLRNLRVISDDVRRLVLRPLIGFNKEEIVELAERIGTRELSAAVAEYCGLAARRPATRAKAAAVAGELARLDLAPLAAAVAARTVVDLRQLDADSIGDPELALDSVPAGATVLDLRSAASFRLWHYPEALCLEYRQALERWRSLPRDRAYVLYCEVGLKSAHVAGLMRQEGLRAHHLRRGVKDARRLGAPADLSAALAPAVRD